jgi:hypothetical protein
MNSDTEAVPDDVVVHRVGGGTADNLVPKPDETSLVPPGISVMLGGSAAEAAAAMRRWFPRMAPRGRTCVGSTKAGQIRQAGFDVIMNPSRRFPQHGRLTHPDGAAGFSQDNRERLALGFTNQTGL